MFEICGQWQVAVTDDRNLLAERADKFDALTHRGVETDFGLPNNFCIVVASPLRDVFVVADNEHIEVVRGVDHAIGAIFCQDDSLGRGQ